MKTLTINKPSNEEGGASKRMMRQRLAGLCLLAIIVVALAPADVRSETVNCTAITTLPYTISTPGSYCLTGHLSTSITGNAITINASDVVLDLNGFALNSSATSDDGTGETEGHGIYALNQKDITIRNGMIKGFKRGIFLSSQLGSNGDTTSHGHVIEDIRTHRNRNVGIYVMGKGSIIRNNHVIDTGIDGVQGVYKGIVITGPGNRVLNNDVISTEKGLMGVTGISLSGDYSVIEGNRISGVLQLGMDASGINVAVVNNRFTGTFGAGISLSILCFFRDNLILSTTFPYYGSGTDLGGNYPQP